MRWKMELVWNTSKHQADVLADSTQIFRATSSIDQQFSSDEHVPAYRCPQQ
jgi:hypothetical protein